MALETENVTWERSLPYETEQLKISKRKGIIRVNVASGKQGDYWVCISPSLNVSSYGKTLKEAQEDFIENLMTFIEDLHELDTGKIDQILREMGWKKGKIVRRQFSKSFVDENGILQSLEQPRMLSLDTVAV